MDMQELKVFAGSPSWIVKQEFLTALNEAIKSAYTEAKVDSNQLALSISTPEASLGDLSSSVAFKLAKIVKEAPSAIAKKLIENLSGKEYVSKFTELNGYINAFIDEKKYGELVINSVMESKERYGSSKTGEGKKVIVEFPSVNPAHPWHVGHLRNALLGDTVSNLFEFCSYAVEREDFINNLGLQEAQALWGWFHLSDKPDKKFDQWLGELYVKVNKEAEVRDIKGEVDELLKKMEDTDSEESKLGREIEERCVLAQQETAFAYGIYHDVMIWESDIVKANLFSKALELVTAQNILEKPNEGKYAGATVVKLESITKYAKELEGSREDAKVIVRSNGTATYIGKDFAFHAWKFGLIDEKFKYRNFIERQPNGKPLFTTSSEGSEMSFGNVKKAINVIDVGQAYEQQIMRVMFYLIGHDEIANNIVHLAYGKVSLEGEKLSGRKGNWLGEERNYTADDLLRETKEQALEIASKSEKITNKGDVEKIANAIALSAIKFEYLKVAPEKNIVFSWENALNFEANSGPYVMYTYARARKILAKAGYSEAKVSPADASKITRGSDFELVKLIGTAQELVEKACDESRPNSLTDYLLSMSSLFSKFYETMPVLKGEEAKEARLALVCALSQVIQNVLSLLGITTVEEM